MKRIALFAGLMAAAVVVPNIALAHNCPNEWKAIDAALPTTKVTGAQLAEAKKLRTEGEALHKAGKHTESMAALGKAKGILGIK
jgi:hypothetical protein